MYIVHKYIYFLIKERMFLFVQINVSFKIRICNIKIDYTIKIKSYCFI